MRPVTARRFLLAREPSGGQVHRRYRREVARLLVGGEQRFHLLPKLLVRGAGGAKETRAPFARQLQRGVKQLPDSSRTARRSFAAAQFAEEPGLREAPVPPDRSHRHVEHVRRLLQAQARRRSAVRRRGSGAGSAFRASSARRPAPRDRCPARPARRLPRTASHGAGPGRAWRDPAVRAMSTSTRRMICAATAKKWARFCQRASFQSTSRR